jgi:hypothetical protein
VNVSGPLATGAVNVGWAKVALDRVTLRPAVCVHW